MNPSGFQWSPMDPGGSKKILRDPKYKGKQVHKDTKKQYTITQVLKCTSTQVDKYTSIFFNQFTISQYTQVHNYTSTHIYNQTSTQVPKDTNS